MRLESLTISLKSPYSDPGPNNPYEAKLSLGYNDHKMQVKMSEGTAARILELAGDEIAAAAQVQIADFVRTALSVAKTPMIEAHAVDMEEPL